MCEFVNGRMEEEKQVLVQSSLDVVVLKRKSP